MKTLNQRVTRDIVGTNPVVPLSIDQLKGILDKRAASPVKQARVNGYMHSDGMKQSIRVYKDNDCTSGLVTVKPHTNKDAYISPMKREVWKPKISLKWHEPYRTPLTLQ